MDSSSNSQKKSLTGIIFLMVLVTGMLILWQESAAGSSAAYSEITSFSPPLTDDTYVNSYDPTQIYGGMSTMYIYNAPDGETFSLLQFDGSGINTAQTVVTATLNLHMQEYSSAGGYQATINLLYQDANWNENTVNYTNYPMANLTAGTVTHTLSSYTPGGMDAIDLTDLIQYASEHYASLDHLGFIISLYQVSNEHSQEWYTKESSQTPPELIITYGSGGTPTPTHTHTPRPNTPTVTPTFTQTVDPGEANAVKHAAPTQPVGLYAGEQMLYSIDLSWRGPSTAAITLNDPYPWNRVAYIENTLTWGAYISQCTHTPDSHEVSCGGLFPASDVGVTTQVSFQVLGTCELYRAPRGITNIAHTQIGPYLINPSAPTDVDVPFRLVSSSPFFMPQSVFSPGHSILLFTIPKGDEPNCCTNCGLDVYVVVNGDTGHPIKMENNGQGAGDRTKADFVAGDCHHSLWVKPMLNADYVYNLYVVKAGEPFTTQFQADTLTLSPNTEPDLFTITDLREQFNEYERLHPNSARSDANHNCIRDYYEGLARIYEYTENHHGVVVDVRQDAYTEDHDLNNQTDRFLAFPTIDWVISKFPVLTSLQFIAIIGDDAVVPFFRYPDSYAPGTGEKKYVTKTLKDTHGIAALEDTNSDYILSDTPYTTRTTQTPQSPEAELAVGRIFADTPADLITMIDGYETAILVGAENGSAYVFNIKNDASIDWKINTEFSAIVPLTANGYTTRSRTLDDLGDVKTYGWLDAESGFDWNDTDFIRGIDPDETNTVTVLNSHAAHMSQSTSDDTADLETVDVLLNNAYPGSVWVNFGCHGGYSVSADRSGKNPNYYTDSLVRGALNQSIAYHASTTFGKTSGGKAQLFNDRAHRDFLSNIISTAQTTGQAHLQALQVYVQLFPTPEKRDIYGVYGVILYGLPTQPVTRETDILYRHSSVSEDSNLDAVPFTEQTLQIGFPVILETLDAQNRVSYDLPLDSMLLIQNEGPLFPAISRSFYLPVNSTGITATLTDFTTEPAAESYPLQPLTAGDRTFGIAEEINGPVSGFYPIEPYWQTVMMENGMQKLTIFAAPVRTNLDIPSTIFFRSMDFEISFSSPASSVTIDAVNIHSGTPVLPDSASIPIQVQITTDSAQPLTLWWQVDDGAGSPLRSGTHSFTSTGGLELLDWTTDSFGWLPGAKMFHAALRNADGQAVATINQQFQTGGNAGTLNSDQVIYGPDDSNGTLTLEVRDSSGALLTDLGEVITQTLDGSDIPLNWTGTSTYQANLDVSILTEGGHRVGVYLDGKEIASTDFFIDRTPPVTSVHSPDVTYQPQFPVTLQQESEPSGIDYFIIEYRLEESGTWTVWKTVDADWDYENGLPPGRSLVFGPVDPLTINMGDTVYLRVRAVDRSGNEEIVHSEADTFTIYRLPGLYLPLILR